MAQPFTHSAESLLGFLSQPGRGYYIPYYQRNYSWDDENAEKLVSDIFRGVKRTIQNPNNSIFLGTVILHDETKVLTGVHADTPNLLTKVSNVVDGQQRIVSIGLLACVLSEATTEMAARLRSYAAAGSEFETLARELDNQKVHLQELYSVEIRKTGVQPHLKPLIIRAGDVTSNPVSDQWTLAGTPQDFYKSPSTNFVSEFINGVAVSSISSDDRIGSVVQVFADQVNSEVESVDDGLVRGFLSANSVSGGSLYSFIDYPPGLTVIQALATEEKTAFYGGLMLLAACHFLKNSCHFVVIECQDESIAFDMFQALNATGTPLTAWEVFKPMVVRAFGTSYPTVIKPEVDRIESIFEGESTAGGKEDLTDKVIGSSALIFNGTVISNRFSEERDWLNDTFPPISDPLSIDFVRCLADQAEYREQFIRPRRSHRDSQNFGFVAHLQGLGMKPADADLAALCIFYLRDANHLFAHSVLSVFYAKLLRAQGNTATVANASAEFLSVCKATAAFFTLWMGSLHARHPDADYRKLFQSSTGNISVESGVANQVESFVKSVFRAALEKQSVYSDSDVALSRSTWISKAKNSQWYLKKAVCRFALFTAFHDAAPDLGSGREGLFINGKASSAPFLNCRAWHSSDYEVIEHVATRDKPSKIKFPAHFDQPIYPGNYSVVDRIGNLALLSVPVNSSVYSEWPDKVFYYWSLTQAQSTATGPASTALKTSLGLVSLPPSLSSLTIASNYLSHLAPLALRGNGGHKWDFNFIETRSEHLCERVYDTLDSWIR
jgi:hypothetical protein